MISSALFEAVRPDTKEEPDASNVNFDLLYLAASNDVIDLEDAVDIMLASINELGRESGIYTNKQLERKVRDERARLSKRTKADVSTEFTDYLIERQIDDVIEVSNLTTIQEICFRLHIAGMKRKEISEALGLDPNRTSRALRLARRKVRAAYIEGPYAGWQEVYMSEVNRTRKG